MLLPFARFDNALDAWMRASFGISTGLLFTGTIAVLVFAYLVRFLALALNTVEAGLAKINRNLDDAARMLGRSPGGTLARVHVPLIWGSVLTAVILVFVDVLKELPATLILRPFDFETLAVRVYRFASDERLAEASTAALAIVAGRPLAGDPPQPRDRPRAPGPRAEIRRPPGLGPIPHRSRGLRRHLQPLCRGPWCLKAALSGRARYLRPGGTRSQPHREIDPRDVARWASLMGCAPPSRRGARAWTIEFESAMSCFPKH